MRCICCMIFQKNNIAEYILEKWDSLSTAFLTLSVFQILFLLIVLNEQQTK